MWLPCQRAVIGRCLRQSFEIGRGCSWTLFQLCPYCSGKARTILFSLLRPPKLPSPTSLFRPSFPSSFLPSPLSYKRWGRDTNENQLFWEPSLVGRLTETPFHRFTINPIYIETYPKSSWKQGAFSSMFPVFLSSTFTAGLWIGVFKNII